MRLRVHLDGRFPPHLRESGGFFEHAARRPHIAFFDTLRHSLRPRRFWSWVRVEDPVVPDRLFVYAVLAFPAAMGAALVLTAVLAFLARFSLRAGWPRSNWYSEVFAEVAWPIDSWTWDFRAPSVLGGVVGVLVAPLLLLVFTGSLRLVKVRRVHLLRVIAYTSITPAIVYALANLLWTAAYVTEPLRCALDDGWYMLAPAAGIAWLSWSVACAVRDYLRMPGAWVVAGAVGVAAALVGAIVGSVVYVLTVE